jgi:cytochrome c oxidase subunit II
VPHFYFWSWTESWSDAANAKAFKGLRGGLMKRIAIRALLPTLWAFSVALAFCLPLSPVAAQDQNAQIIEVSAKKYEYSPSPVHVKAGTTVQLKITAVDHDHGFKIGAEVDGARPGGKAGLVFSSPQDCWQLEKGETTTIEFLAQTSGTYTFKCCHTCGLGHRGMKGQIIVEQ